MKQGSGPPITTPSFTQENWRSRAACRFTEPELFFPVSDSGKSLLQVTQARAICAGCAVRRECLAFAVRTRQAHGIWGGLTEQERRAGAGSAPASPHGHELFEPQALAARVGRRHGSGDGRPFQAGARA